MSFLNDRLQQLENRKLMIPRYVERPGKFLGKKDFSLDDLPKIEDDIRETKALILALEKHRKGFTAVYLPPNVSNDERSFATDEAQRTER